MTRTFQSGDCVRFYDAEDKRHYVGNVVGAAKGGTMWVSVPGHGPMLVDVGDLAPHGEPGSR